MSTHAGAGPWNSERGQPDPVTEGRHAGRLTASSSREPWGPGKSLNPCGLGFLGCEGRRCSHRPPLSGTRVSALRGPRTLSATRPSWLQPLLTLCAPPPFQVTSQHSGSISPVIADCSGLRDQDFSTWQDRSPELSEPSHPPHPAPSRLADERSGQEADTAWATAGSDAEAPSSRARPDLVRTQPLLSAPSFLGNEAAWTGRGAHTDSECPVSMN